MKASPITLVLLAALAVTPAGAQTFGFGDEPDATAQSGVTGGVRIGGELGFSALKYFDDLDDLLASGLEAGAQGALDIDAGGGKVDAALHLDIDGSVKPTDPLAVLDEAYLRLGLFPFLDLEGGIRKIAWGRADTLSALDVVNARDLTDLTVSDPLDQKVSQVMLRAVTRLGAAAQLDLVYLPFLEGDRIAWVGRWAPSRINDLRGDALTALFDGLLQQYQAAVFASAYTAAYATAYPLAYAEAYATAFALTSDPNQSATIAGAAASAAANNAATTAANDTVAAQDDLLRAQAAEEADASLADLVVSPDTHTFEYGQAGARLTATVGPLDLGAQYFYGYLHTPVINTDPAAIEANGGKAEIAYNRYHHAGIDAAVVVAGFATRLEGGINLTDDLDGTDPLVYNPTVGWAAGFDRDLFAGLSLNVQARGTVRLWHEGITDAYDIESGAGLTSTQIAVALSQRLFRDVVEWRVAGVMSPEDLDFALDPSVTINVGDAKLELFGRVFGGEATGDLGQYAQQSYAGVRLSYVF